MSWSELAWALNTLLRLCLQQITGRGAVERLGLVAEGFKPKGPP